jgi:hypothetical protein
MTPDAALLADAHAIRDVLHAYAEGVDRRDWALFRDCFLDEVTIDLSSWDGRPATTQRADAWVAGVRAGISGFEVTQHLTGNHRVTVDGDRARCTSDVQATHVLDGERVVLGGWYETALRRTAAGWRIAAHTLHVTWRDGRAELFAEARRGRGRDGAEQGG